jgi:uncharacterized protein YjbI with pentapeptide repeats
MLNLDLEVSESMTKQCKYDLLGDEEYECKHSPVKEDLCIFHLPKLSDEEGQIQGSQLSSTIRSEFKQEFWKLVALIDADPTAVGYDFRGFSFPEFTFERRTFAKRFDCRHATFSHWVDFRKVVFTSDVSFEFAKFQGGVWFIESVFRGQAEFSSAVFGKGGEGQVNFFRASFIGVADFIDAHFHQSVSFRRVTFSESALFGTCAFAFGSDFTSSIFKQQADFRGLTAGGRTIFANAEFQGVTRFTGAILSGETLFRGDSENKCFSTFCRFNGVRIANEGALVFEKVSLERAGFFDTNLDEILFRDVDWYHIDSRIRLFGFSRAQSLWDEFRPMKSLDRDYAKIAENYGQLVLNYEGKRDFDTAEHFHIGEMEMRRKKTGAKLSSPQLRKLREWVNGYGAYRASSNYGTSYSQALIILVAMLLFFALMFQYSGFKTSSNAPDRIIEYNVFPDSSHRTVTAKEWLDDYFSAMTLCLSVVTFQKDRFYEPLEGYARAWLFLAVITLTGQTAMTLLAIRRRFRR